MDFIGELKQAQARKSASNDMIYKLVFETDDIRILDLGKLPSDSLFKISVNLESTKKDKPEQENAGYKAI